MLRIVLSLTICLVMTPLLMGKNVYVSTSGSDTADGSESSPLGSIEKAASKVSAGDTIVLRGGRYAEPAVIRGLKGRENKPITITSHPGEKVLFDGTDLLEGEWKQVTPGSAEGKLIQKTQWRRIGDNKLYSMKVDNDIYALIYDGKLMSDARWPNARWDDPWRLDRYNVLRRATEKSTPGQLHDGLPTENTFEESSKWILYDRDDLTKNRESLAETGLDFSDAVVVISYAWTSFGTRITAHEAGSNSFKFDTEFTGSGSLQKEAVSFVINRLEWDNPKRFKKSGHGGIHFFFEGLPALDIQQEWWYHQPTKTLYFISPDGEKPQTGKTRGKRRDYLVTVKDSNYVHFKGTLFFGSAILMEDCENSRIEDCNFKFSAYNKFALGNFDMPVTVRIANQEERELHHNALLNCQFTYLDGNAFEGRSGGLTIDNILIYRTQQTTLGSDSRSMSIDRPLVVRRCTIDDVGASVGIKGGGIDSVYELNNISRFGGLQYDGAALQMGGRNHFIYRYNWSHDHPKRSYRFDAASYPEYSNAFGEMSYNIAWNTPGGFAIKGDDHLIQNNVLIGETKMELFNMERWASENKRTLVANNIVPAFSAGINDRVESKSRKRAEVVSIMKNNFTDDPATALRDPDNLDFRPKKGSSLIGAGYEIQKSDVPWKKVPFTGAGSFVGKGPDIGAYEYGSQVYWIPGFQFAHASTPVPPDGTKTAKSDCDLMWLGGYKANSHELYFGTSHEEVSKATKNVKAFKKSFAGTDNIFTPPSLRPGATYYWRVDAVRNGKVNKGRIWQFSVGTAADDLVIEAKR